MSFPGTYNFNYYKGDTFEFRIYPKDSTGLAFALADYSALFTIAPARGSSGVANKIECDATITVAASYVTCVITPTKGNQLQAGTTYYYDVEISKPGNDYTRTYTLVTGTVAVTEQVSGAI